MPVSSNNVPLSSAEMALKRYEIAYEKQADGTLVVPGELDISGRNLTQLPDFSAVIVKGSFKCSDNRLTNLVGAPQSVGRSFYCNDNELTSLKGAPRAIEGDFHCSSNDLKTLDGAPDSVGRAFYCYKNPLVNLDRAPAVFGSLLSEFGEFASWNDVPDKAAPQVKLERNIRNATVLQQDVKVGTPMRFKANKLNL